MPQPSPVVSAFLDSLKEEYPDEFTLDTPEKYRRQYREDINIELDQLMIIEDEQRLNSYAEQDQIDNDPIRHPYKRLETVK
jgi:hypothetical protein